MGARSKARRRALEILYEADIRGLDARDIAEERVADRPLSQGDYAVELVNGVSDDRDSVDAELLRCSEEWDPARMPVVDRNLLRMGAWELRAGAVPSAVVIDEAVELARSLSTDDSPRFVNGMLARISRERAQRAVEPQLGQLADSRAADRPEAHPGG